MNEPYFSYKLDSKENTKKAASYLNFDDDKMSKEQLVELLCNFGMSECTAKQYLIANDGIYFEVVTSGFIPTEIRITNRPVGAIDIELCRFIHKVTGVWAIKVNYPAMLSKFINANYYSTGEYPKIGDVLNIPSIFGYFVVIDEYGDILRVSPVSSPIRHPHQSNSVNGYEWRISEVVFTLEIDAANMKVNINDGLYSYSVCDHIINSHLPKRE